MNQLRKRTFFVLVACSILGVAQAGTVDLSFNQVVGYSNTTATMAGTAPWFDLAISDTATAGTLQFVLSTPKFTGSQTLDGIFLNVNPTLAGTLTGVSISGATLGNAPAAFATGATSATTSSAFDTTQAIAGGFTAAQGGSYDLYLKFPAGVVTPTGAGSVGETFDLVFTGAAPVATSFLTQSLAKTTGGPSFFGLAAVSNSGGAGASGIAYLSAAPVPEPGEYILMLIGFGLIGFLVRRSKLGSLNIPMAA